LSICGSQLTDSYMQPVVVDVSQGNRTLSEASLPATVFLKFTQGCGAGVDVTVEPAGSAVLVRQAASGDRRIAAAQVQVVKTPTTLRITRPDGTVSTVAVRSGA